MKQQVIYQSTWFTEKSERRLPETSSRGSEDAGNVRRAEASEDGLSGSGSMEEAKSKDNKLLTCGPGRRKGL